MSESPEQKARRAEYLRKWRAANPEKVREQQRRYRQGHPEKAAKDRARMLARDPDYWYRWQQERKARVITAYGGKCACCGESELTFLSMDHVNGGGRRERLSLGNSAIFKRLLAALPDLLPDFRVLCMNCQFGYMHGRTCPHQT